MIRSSRGDSREASGAGSERGPAPAADRIEIVYYTDPLCCWSWAFEPHWRQLQLEFGDALSYRYRMAGMIPDWASYSDPLNSVSRPVQMGPIWRQAQHISGVPIDDRIWVEDPPNSSYPACIAVKAADLQSAEAADMYLRRLRQAVMSERRNIARREVLLELADELAAAAGSVIDPHRLRQDLDSDAALASFREDVKEARYRGIGRYPTLTLQGCERGIIIVGYRPYEVLTAALARIARGSPAPVAPG